MTHACPDPLLLASTVMVSCVTAWPSPKPREGSAEALPGVWPLACPALPPALSPGPLWDARS